MEGGFFSRALSPWVQMWVRKKENEYILAMLDRLEMLKETPSGAFHPTHAHLQT